MHLNNKSSLRKKQQEHVTLACILFFSFEGCKQNLSLWCLVAFFSALLPKTESSRRCRNSSCHWSGSPPRDSSSSLSHPSESTQFAPFSLPSGRIFLFFYHPAVCHVAFTTLWCIGTSPGPFLQTLHPHNVSTVQLLCH